eukprot:6486097-Amphidinium_carterae.1
MLAKAAPLHIAHKQIDRSMTSTKWRTCNQHSTAIRTDVDRRAWYPRAHTQDQEERQSDFKSAPKAPQRNKTKASARHRSIQDQSKSNGNTEQHHESRA